MSASLLMRRRSGTSGPPGGAGTSQAGSLGVVTTGQTSGPTSIVLPVTNSVAVGDAVVAFFYSDNNPVPSSVVDDAGNTYTLRNDQIGPTGRETRHTWTFTTIATAPLTVGQNITCNFVATAGEYRAFTAVKVPGAKAIDFVGGFGRNDTQWSTGTTGTLSDPNSVAVSFASFDQAASSSAPNAGQTELFEVGNGRLYTVTFQSVAATTALNHGGTWGGSNFSTATICVVRCAGPVVTQQFARPASDVSLQNWSLQGSGASGAARIGEAVVDDATFIQESSAATDLAKFTLSTITDPQVSTGHSIRVRAKSSAAATGTVSVELRNAGGTVVYKALTNIGTLTTSYVNYDIPLTSAEAQAITSYAGLELWITGVSGGLNSVYVSQAYLVSS